MSNPRRVYSNRQQSVLSEASIPLEELKKEWRPIFDQFDEDGDGEIPLSELSSLLRDPSNSNQIPANVIDEILARADDDQNGRLDFEEFLDMVQSHEFREMRPLLRRTLKYAAFVVVPKRHRSKLYSQQYSCRPPPLFMPIISIIEIAVFIYYAINFVSTVGWISATGPVPFTSVLIYNPYKRYQAWRFGTYMFIHAGIAHIVFNVLVQLILGVPLEMVHHWWRIMIVYFAGVLAGSLGTSISDPTVFLAGASGGVYALITAHLATIILNWSEMEYAVYRIIGFLFITGVDLSVAIYSRYIKNENSQIGYAAHLAGAIAGLLIGIGVLKNLKWEKWETIVWWISIALFIILAIVAIAWNVFFPSYFQKSIYD